MERRKEKGGKKEGRGEREGRRKRETDIDVRETHGLIALYAS